MYECYFCGGPTDTAAIRQCDACVERKLARECEARERANAQHRERARIYMEGDLPVRLDARFRSKLGDRDKNVCGICDQKVDYRNGHVDHIIPISRGGFHEWDNVRLVHSTCNLRKGNRG